MSRRRRVVTTHKNYAHMCQKMGRVVNATMDRAGVVHYIVLF